MAPNGGTGGAAVGDHSAHEEFQWHEKLHMPNPPQKNQSINQKTRRSYRPIDIG